MESFLDNFLCDAVGGVVTQLKFGAVTQLKYDILSLELKLNFYSLMS